MNNSHVSSDPHAAALTLNYCAASITSIIQYEDCVVRDQEYDAILNRINMEVIAKDDELRLLFNRMLETLTHYKLQEGDRAWVDKEYQQNMKNAIFSCLPQFNVIVAGGNPWTMLFSAVHQIGVGFFNYRRNVAQYRLNKDKALWQLKKQEIVELNALRTELFNASWALADRYGYPDEWRLTQQQIEKYIQTLQDENRERMLERLDYLSDEFQAFPPFWYNKGKTALDLALVARDESENDACAHFMNEAGKAYEHFEQIWKPIVRSDPYASSAALDQIAMLEPAKDSERIRRLLGRVRTHAKYDLDVMQLASMHCLSIGDSDEASRLLRMLINEEHNIELNGKILSRIYVELGSDEDYNRLRKRIGAKNVVDKVKPLSAIAGDINELADAALERSEKFAAIAGIAYANVMLAPLSDKIDEYIETDAEEMTLKDIASYFQTEDIAVLLDKGKTKADAEIYDVLVADVLVEMGRDVQDARRPLDKRIVKATEKYLESVIEVELIGSALLGTQSSFLGRVAKGAAVGAAAGLFLGPIGAGACIVGNLIHDYAKENRATETGENFDKAVLKSLKEYDKMYERVTDVAKTAILSIYTEIVQELKTNNESAELRDMIEGLTEAITEAESETSEEASA